MIAICMATYEPDAALLRRQVESIREQTRTDWICLISDDASSEEGAAAIRKATWDDSRFRVTANSEHVGFYRNFERALGLVADEAGDAALVALCDQDDLWRADKLERLAEALSGGALLAHSDLRLVDPDGGVLSETYWTERGHGGDRFDSLLVANTVTGAATMFKRELLDVALPFPEEVPPVSYHDHWLALAACAQAPVAYVDEPLVEYTQHPDPGQGHAASHQRGLRENLGRLREEGVAGYARRQSETTWRRTEIFAAALEQRLGERMRPEAWAAIEAFGDDAAGARWLLRGAVRELRGEGETLGRERALLAALAWRRLSRGRSR